MKTKLLLIALAFGLMSGTCEADKAETTVNCKCGIVREKIVFNIPNNIFTKLTIENDCTHELKEIQVTGNQGTVNEEYCTE